MFSHIMLGVNDMDKSKAFYDALFAVLGAKPGVIDPKGRCFYFHKDNIFMLTNPINGEPACNGNGSTIGFAVDGPEQADAWHAAGVANGGVSIEDAPGIRTGGKVDMYLAYLRDPAGNKICALHRMPSET
ncbi:MAG: VOC family protein [Granulosicoccaceae bacterium]